MMLSVIVTSKHEPKTIGKAVKCLIDAPYSRIKGDFELITVVTDKETEDAVKSELKNFPKVKWVSLFDDAKGKPAALNKAFKAAHGEYLLLTDGDVYFEEGAAGKLMDKMKSDKKIGGVTGRPISMNDRKTMFGYYGNLLADAAHHKRMSALTDAEGYSRIFVKKNLKFFAMSGYISLIRNLNINIPKDCLIDDAYLSYAIFNKGYQIAYEPEAKVSVKYPTHFKDWMKQKVRSAGGYVQLWKYNVVRKETKVRNFWKELEYFWFPVKYAKSIKEFWWSLLLYPLRFILWVRIYWERKILNKDFSQTWKPVESTK